MKIREILFTLLSIILTTDLFGQEKEVVKEIIIDSKLFNQSNQGHYNFTVHNGVFLQSAKREETGYINEVVSVDKDCLSFTISYGCGCGQTTSKLVIGGKPFDTEVEVLLDEINEEEGYSVIRMYQNVNSAQLTDVTYEYLKKSHR